MHHKEEHMLRKTGCINAYETHKEHIKLNTKAKAFKYEKILPDTIGNGS